MVQILVTEKSRGCGICLSIVPMIVSEKPYIGEESIIAPPRSKKLRSTGKSEAAAALSGGTLNVIQLPTPMAGSVSPLAGTACMIGARPCAQTGPDQNGAAAPAATPASKRRRRGEAGRVFIAQV